MVLVIAAIGIPAGGFMARRWWIRRRNPRLFREYDEDNPSMREPETIFFPVYNENFQILITPSIKDQIPGTCRLF
jgi:hypothetical protein